MHHMDLIIKYAQKINYKLHTTHINYKPQTAAWQLWQLAAGAIWQLGLRLPTGASGAETERFLRELELGVPAGSTGK